MGLIGQVRDYIEYRKAKSRVERFESLPENIRYLVPHEIVDAYLVVSFYEGRRAKRDAERIKRKEEREVKGAIEEFTLRR